MRIDVFFYGLFMDSALLRARGFDPAAERKALLRDFRLVIGRRATVVRSHGGEVHGVVMSLETAELARLYSDPALSAYVPVEVQVHADDGPAIAAQCYVLPKEPAPSERNEGYAATLRETAVRVGLPTDYIGSIE